MFVPAREINHLTAASELAAGIAAISAGQTSLTFKQTQQVDSSAVACLLAWKRQAISRGVKLEFQDLPNNLKHLIDLYGISTLLD